MTAAHAVLYRAVVDMRASWLQTHVVLDAKSSTCSWQYERLLHGHTRGFETIYHTIGLERLCSVSAGSVCDVGYGLWKMQVSCWPEGLCYLRLAQLVISQ